MTEEPMKTWCPRCHSILELNPQLRMSPALKAAITLQTTRCGASFACNACGLEYVHLNPPPVSAGAAKLPAAPAPNQPELGNGDPSEA